MAKAWAESGGGLLGGTEPSPPARGFRWALYNPQKLLLCILGFSHIKYAMHSCWAWQFLARLG